MLLAQHSVYAVAVWSFGHTGFVTVVVTRPVSMDAQRWVPSPSDAPVAATRALEVQGSGFRVQGSGFRV